MRLRASLAASPAPRRAEVHHEVADGVENRAGVLERVGRPADHHAQRPGAGALHAAADRRVEHGDTRRRVRGDRVDGGGMHGAVHRHHRARPGTGEHAVGAEHDRLDLGTVEHHDADHLGVSCRVGRRGGHRGTELDQLRRRVGAHVEDRAARGRPARRWPAMGSPMWPSPIQATLMAPHPGPEGDSPEQPAGRCRHRGDPSTISGS